MEPVRIADGDGKLAHAQLVRITQAHRLEIRSVDADDRQVRLRVCTDDSRLRPPAIGQRTFNPVRAVDDVTVGEGKAIGRDDETRPAAAALAAAASGIAFAHINFHHRRADRFRRVDNGIGIRIQQYFIGGARLLTSRLIRNLLRRLKHLVFIRHRQHAKILFCNSHVTTPPFPAIGNK